jgi:radical SAM protein
MKRQSLDFNKRPILVFWEVTKACKLKCKHCRAEAIEEPLPGELTTEEGMSFIKGLLDFGRPYPVLILTGGDPLMRPDIYDLIAYARGLGIPVGLAPSVTPLLDEASITKLKKYGVRSISISLDSANPEIHDKIRGIEGHFSKTVESLRTFVANGFEVQVNTAVMRDNVNELADMAKLLVELGVKTWEVFFLIKVGRGTTADDITPTEYEDVLHFLYDASKYCMTVRTVEAPFFRRVTLWRRRDERAEKPCDPLLNYRLGSLYLYLSGRLKELLGEPRCSTMAYTVGTRDGKGIIFVAYNGDVSPSGFLPYRLGNVKSESLAKIYRENPILIKIREAKFGGKCGICEYRDLCGGSRSRAFAEYGDVLAEDPACIYIPKSVIRRRAG